jgi:hypothetical protein
MPRRKPTSEYESGLPAHPGKLKPCGTKRELRYRPPQAVSGHRC